MRPPTDEEKALAERMVEAALKKLEPIEVELRYEIRESLLDDLLCSPDGRRRLREAMPDVAPGRSGDVDRSGADAVDDLVRKRGRLDETTYTKRTEGCREVHVDSGVVGGADGRQIPLAHEDEFLSAGGEALTRAVLGFKPGAATFETYAYACVKGTMLELVRTTAKRGKLSPGQEKYLALEARCDGLGRDEDDLGAATPEEGTRKLDDYLRGRASELALAYWLGMEQSTPNEDDLVEGRARQARLANVRAILALQTEEVREFYRPYYEKDATLAEIASAKGVSVKTVQRIQTKLKVAVQTAITMHDSGAP